MLFVYTQDLKLLNNTTEIQKGFTNTEVFLMDIDITD